MTEDQHVDKSGWVVGKALDQQVANRPDSPFLQFQDSPPLSFAQVDAQTNRLANGLLPHAISPGDSVGVMLPNSMEYCLIWFALSRLGAVHVAINTAYKGIFLAHVLNNSQARLLFIHADYLGWLAEIEDDVPILEKAFVLGLEESPHHKLKRVELVPFNEVNQGRENPVEREVTYRDTGAIMYTSGTTGPSKGVIMPHAHLYLFGLGEMDNLALTDKDIYYICMPLFHANAMLMQLYGCLVAGCKAVIVPGFSASRWLDDVRGHNATVTNTLGVMTEFIYRQPPRPEDQDNPLRLICAVPAPKEIARDFMQRFDLQLIEGYGMTEVNIPLYMPLDAPYRPGSCGRAYDRYFDIKVVHPDTDEDMLPNTLGEIVVRPREPYCFMAGYNAMPDKTVEAWRNFWFHTGDGGYVDEEGYFFFVDRIKDTIRRRGENLSSYEIEAVLAEHPAVAEAAAIAVKSELVGGEDEVKACIVLHPGQTLTPEDLLDYCTERMPHFSVPRFVEYLQELPKTPTQKVRKRALREAGNTPGTWDREAAGYQVRRN